jgi:branched-chain amino acid transport system substrate-binding protein
MVLSSGPIKIGILFSQTGVTSVVEDSQLRAALLAVNEVNEAGGIGGAALSPILSDPASDPKIYAREARRLVEDGCEVICGCYMSSTRRAVLPIIERAGALLFYPTLYEGFEFSANCIYSGAAPNQNSLMLADFAMERFGKRYYLVGSNYVFPYESNRIMRDLLGTRGGTVVEERYIPLQPSGDDVRRVVDEIVRLKPDVVFSTIVGDGAKSFYQAYAHAGIDRERTPIMSLTTGEPEVAAMGADVAEGHYTSAPYFASLASETNRRFVAAYRAENGATAPISACTEAAYFQIHLFAEAARRAQSLARADILDALPQIEYAAPQGPVRIDAKTQHPYLRPRIGRVNRAGGFEIVCESEGLLRPDPYMVDPEAVGWGRFAAGL